MGYEQFLVHLVGDYCLQSPWMALNKSKKSLNCLVHVLIYTACFLVLTRSWKVLAVIGASHFLIDRFGLARYFVWLKNHFAPGFYYPPWIVCFKTGYYDNDTLYVTEDELRSGHLSEPQQKIVQAGNKASLRRLTAQPSFMTVWLTIAADNTLHLIINYLAIRYTG